MDKVVGRAAKVLGYLRALFAVGEDLTAESAEVPGAKPAPNLDELVSAIFDFGGIVEEARCEVAD
jgi:hypothetical protein